MARFDFPDARSAGDVTTLAWLLRWRAASEPDRVGYVFLGGDLDVETTRTYGELDRSARAIAVRLRQAGLVAGDRALLLYLPGVDFVSAFFGCLYAGVIAVPAFPPDPIRFERTLPRLLSIIADAGPAAVLTTESLRGLADGLPDLGLPWLATDDVPGAAADDWTRPAADGASTAMLQYTSGSTGTPKGVMLTHANLLHNSGLIQQFFHTTPQTRGLSWLPPYHDMGLIGCVLQPLFAGLPIWLMSPLDFLRRPQSWLEAVDKFGITMTGGPNFAYDLCVRRTTPEQRAQLSLGGWQVAFNGAEPVRRSTMERFAAAFAPAGFRAEAFLPCYGLAEATLIVSGGSLASTAGDVDPAALGRGEVVPGPAGGPVSCGPVSAGQQVAVVDPESRERRAPDRVGEIWLRGPSVAAGYWERPEETGEVFHARIAGESDENWLRTGDLGFVRDGELVVTGRLKDLIIVRGRNHYPQDLEVTAERAHPALRPGCAAAFTVEHDGEDRVAIVHEVTRAAADGLDVAAVAGEIRRAVAEQHGVQVALVVLIPPGALPKTSSGKVQRAACRSRLLAGDLPELGRDETGRNETASTADEPAPSREQLLAAEAGDRHALIVRTLRGWAAEACGVSAPDLAPEAPLLAAGLDSLAAQQLGQRVEQQLGVVFPLADVLAGAGLADLADRLAEQLGAAAVRPVAAPIPAAAPSSGLTPGQRALWFLHQLDPDSTAHTTAAAVRLTGPLDEAALTAAFAAVLRRHPGLRDTFALVDGEPVRRPGPGGEILRSDVDPEQVPARLAADANQPFDLATGPLVRLHLYRVAPGEHVVLLTAHHIATDFWSTTILARELAAVYTGRTLPPVPPALASPPPGDHLLDYWKRQYGAGVPRLELPARDPSGTSQRAGVHRFRLDGDLLARLRQRAVDEGVTVNMLLLAGYQALLHRLTGQDDLVVGTPLAARNRPGADGVVGYLMNPVLIRSRVTGAGTFRELLRQARSQVVGAIEHQDLPSALLAEQLTMPRHGLFQAMYVFNRPSPADTGAFPAALLGHGGVVRELGGLRAESLPVDQRDSAFDLELAFADLGDAVHGSLRFRDDVLDRAAGERFVRQYTALLDEVATDPAVRLGGLPRATGEEHDRAVRQWNATEREHHARAGLPELFAARARRTPDDIAVQAGAETLTYRALADRAAGFAARLRETGAGPGGRVGILLDRSPDLIAALLGVLRTGAAYVPVDPMSPPGRVAATFADAGVTAVLSHRDLAEKLSGADAPVVFADDVAPAGDDPAITRGDVAYLVYTSGSTGEPKGVEVSHGSLLNFTLHAAEQYGLGPQDRVLQFASMAFDTSAEEIFPTLLSGARLVLRDDRMLADPATFLDACATAGVTVLDLPTAYWHDLVVALGEGHAELPAALRLVIIGGERALPERVALWHERVGTRVRLINTYGPTEATVVATSCELTGAGPELGAPIGRPIANTRAYVLDDRTRPVPVGVVGELYLGGAGLAYGYRGRPALTAAHFVADPFGPAGARLYRTGDLARYLPDGSITFVARADRQIKLNGYRVELGEVESALRRLPGVTDAAVTRHTRPGQLLAYVTPASVAVAELRTALRAVLPGYMVPAWCVPLAELPRTPNGKIDYAGLPPVGPDEVMEDAAAPGEPPRTPIERDLAAIWRTILEVPRVHRQDDFFVLGGHSLLATRMLAHVNHQLGVDLPLRAIFEAPALAAFAARVAQSPVSPVAPVPPAPRDEPLPLSFVQERIWFLHQLQPGSTNYNVPRALRLRGHVDLETVTAALAGLEERHEILRTVFPDIDGEPVQVVLEPKGIPVALVDRRDLPAGDRQSWLDDFVRTAGQQPFDLVTGPLLRVTLVRLADDEYVLVVVEHHLIHDGWTQGVFLRDFLELYEARSLGREPNLPHLPVQYADFAVWQRRQMQGERLESLLAYWRARMAGAAPVLELPTDRPRPRKLTTRGGQEILEIDGELARGLRELGRRQDVTLFMSMFTGFVAVMHGLSGQDDIVLGAGIANRQRPELENLIGMIINTVLLRTDLSGDPSFAELLHRVRETCLDAYAHQDMPFDKLVEHLRPVRSVSHMPLFQVMFSFLDTPMPELRLPGVTLEVLDAHNGSAKFDLNAVIIPHAEQRFQDGGAPGADETITVLLEYNADLFDPATVAGFLEQYEHVLRAMVTQPDRPVGELLSRAR